MNTIGLSPVNCLPLNFFTEVNARLRDGNTDYFRSAEFSETFERLLWRHRLLGNGVLRDIFRYSEPEDPLKLLPIFGQRLGDKRWKVRRAAVVALGSLLPHLEFPKHLEIMVAVKNRREDRREDVRIAAAALWDSFVSPFLAGVEKKIQDGEAYYFGIAEFLPIWAVLTGEMRLQLASVVGQKLEDKEREVRSAAIGALKTVIPHLKPTDRLKLALAVERRLEDERGDVRDAAIGALKTVIPHLKPTDRLKLALAVERRLEDKRGDVREAAVEALCNLTPCLKIGHRPERLLAIEKMLEDKERKVRDAAIGALKTVIPHLKPEDCRALAFVLEKYLRYYEEFSWNFFEVVEGLTPHLRPTDRLKLAPVIEKWAGEEDAASRQAAIILLGAVIYHLEEGLALALAFERRLADPRENIRETAVTALRIIGPTCDRDEEVEEKSLAILRNPQAGREKKERAVAAFAYAQGPRLSTGARRLLILLGRRMLEGEVGSLEEFSPQAGYRYELKKAAERLQELARDFRIAEALLKGYPTVGGKIRRLQEKTKWGYLSGSSHLIIGEGEPILLEPVWDPLILAQTVEELVFLPHPSGFREFRFSLTVSGKVGDDLKPAALGLHALLKRPYPFPETIKSGTRFGWFAPVVEGPNLWKLNENEWEYRYDHFFLGFETPPSLEEFAGGKAEDRWVEARGEFVGALQPRIFRMDGKGRNIQIYLEGKNKHFLWFPAKSEWEAMTRKTQEGRLEIHEPTFQTLLFLEFGRRALREEIMEVIETGWGLGILRKMEENGEGAMEANILQNLNRPALKALAQGYEEAFTKLLKDWGLNSLLETPWVGNTDWPSIRESLRDYQGALEKDDFRIAVQTLVRKTIAEVRTILF